MRKMRIEQHFLMTDYSLWEVILNGDSPTPTRIVDGVVQVIAPTNTKQRLAKKNELKAKGTLLMALPDKHQLKFNIHKDVKSLMEPIEKRFCGNKEAKKVQKSILKQQYENFSGTSSESFDQIHDRLQKLISQLEILADLKDQSLDDLFNNLEIYEVEVKSSSSTSHNTQNIAFVSSNNTDNTNESVSVVPSVSAASTKASVSTLPNVDNLSDAVIYSFFASQSNSPRLENEDLKQIDADYLEEMDLKWQMAMLIMRARMFLQMTGRNLGANGTSAIWFDMSKCDGVGSYDWSFRVDEEPTNYALMAFTFSSSSSFLGSDNETSSKNLSKLLESQITNKTGLGYDNQVFNSTVFDCDELNSSGSDESVPTSPVHDRYKTSEGYHVVPPPYRGTFMPPKPNLVFHDALTDSKTVLDVVNVEASSTKPSKDLTSVKPFEHSTQAENLKKDTQKSRGHKHSWTRKAYFVYKSLNHLIKDCDFYETQMVQKPVWNHAMRVNHQNSARMTHPYFTRHVVPTAVLTRSRLVHLSAARPVTTVVPQPIVKSPKPIQHVVNKAHSLIRRPINHRPAPTHRNFHKTVTTVKVNKIQVSHGLGPQKTLSFLFDVHGNPQQNLKDKGVIDSGCLIHMTGNICYLLDFKEINEGYVAFGGNPKGGKITGRDTECVVLSSDFNLPDENHVLLRVSRENNMHNIDLKNVVPSGDLICLFAKATLDESNILHSGLGHINFKTMNKLVKGSGPKWLFDIDTLTQSMNYQPVIVGNQPNPSVGIKKNIDAGKVRKETEYAQQYVLLPLWSTGSKDPQNTYADVAFDVKETESEVHVSPSSSNKTKKHDDKANRESKGKIPVNLSIRVRDLRDEFKEFSVNSTNRVNDASAPVTAVRPNSTNSTNSFNADSPSDNVVSPTFEIDGKSSFVDPSQYRDDPDMPASEDIVYSDDDEDVGVEVDFSNLETNISVSSIPTTRVHKDHHVTQIIGDLTSVPQTRSIAKMVKEQGFEDTDYPDKVYMVVKALYGLHQAPRAWYETLANYFLENGFQKGKIDQTLFIKKQKGLQVKQKDDRIFISQDKYVAEILRKFGLTDGKSASTPIDTEKPLLKDLDGEDVDVHIYRCCSLNAARSQVSADEGFLYAIRWISKGFSGIETPLFDTMLVQPQVQDDGEVEEDEDDIAVPAAPTPPSPTPATTLSSPLHEHIPSPPQEQPTQPIDTLESLMTLLNRLMETCVTLTQKVAHLEQDKVAQELDIVKLKQRVKKLEKKRRSKSSGLKRLRKVGTSQRVESSNDTVVDAQDDDADIQGRIEEDVTAVKEINVIEHEPTVFNDEEMQEKNLDNIKKYQSLKRKPISVAQVRKNMIVYLKNMDGYKIQYFKGMAYDQLRAKVEVSGFEFTQDTPTVDPTEMSEEDVKNMLQIVPMAEFKVEALQVKYTLIDWEIYPEGSRSY
nr:hypothetical protein [Tanacetum cinerariifolium]